MGGASRRTLPNHVTEPRPPRRSLTTASLSRSLRRPLIRVFDRVGSFLRQSDNQNAAGITGCPVSRPYSQLEGYRMKGTPLVAALLVAVICTHCSDSAQQAATAQAILQAQSQAEAQRRLLSDIKDLSSNYREG